MLTDLEAQSQAATTKLRNSLTGEVAFDGVDVVTPSDAILASSLTLSVKPGNSLMVTGPNGTGKSSFFRVLGGLWPVAKGNISVPCDATGTPGIRDVFLVRTAPAICCADRAGQELWFRFWLGQPFLAALQVPQRMYMVLGSLADQLTYPEVLRAGGAELTAMLPKLQALLDLVGIGYLPSREWGWGASVRWEDVLSLGEQQRIGMARLFYHCPRYGVLDECTSAVSVDVEERLYREARRLGITCITLSQRLALSEFHTHELQLGQDSKETRWSLRSLHDDDDTSDAVAAAAAANKMDEEAARKKAHADAADAAAK